MHTYGAPVFTEEEQQWIKAHPVVTVGVDGDFRPFEFIASDGKYGGLAAAYLQLINKQTGIRFEFEDDKPWAELLAEAKSGEIDLISAIVRTPQRQESLHFSTPYSSFANVIVTRSDDTVITGIRSLIHKTIAVEAGSYADELMHEQYPDIKLKAYPTRRDALAAVATGEADAHIGNLAQATYLIRRENFSNLEIAGPGPFSHLELRMASADPVLITIIDKVLADIGPEEQAKIEEDWIAVRYEHVNFMLLGRWGIAVLVVVALAGLWIVTLQRQIQRRKRYERELVKARHEEIEARRVAENAQALQAKALALAEEATARKSEFLSIAAHDLKNPIGSIRGLADLLVDEMKEAPEETNPVHLDIIKTIEEAADNMLELVNELLNVEAIESGVITVNDACIRMPLLLKDVIELNQHPAKKKNIELDYRDEMPGAIVCADAGRMLEVLDNLVNNAVKYTPPGTRVTVCLRPSPEKRNSVRCSVLDQGPGLTTKDQEKLFQRFSKGSARPTGEETSTGLGLAIVKKLVSQMHGHVWAENREDCKGAAFHCEFPLYDTGEEN